jgi:transcriptional regulator with XRE-family HTH domain
MKNIKDLISELPAERRARVKARADQLIGEEMALQQLRKARRFTQERIAEILDIGQDSVSRMENRTDLLLSTLQSYVEAMGGKLQLIVEFPEGVATLSSSLLGTIEEAKSPIKEEKRQIQKAIQKRKALQLAHAND